MENIYIWNKKLESLETDMARNLRPDGAVSIFQEVALRHAKEMGVDFEDVRTQSGVYWVITKLKYKLLNPLKFNDEIVVKTFPTSFDEVRFLRGFQIFKGETLSVNALSEWCILDIKSGKIMRTSSINYPKNLLHIKDESGLTFTRKVNNIDNFCYKRVIRSTDIDLNLHTNNVNYMKMAVDSFTTKELADYNFTEVEIHFNSESHEKDEISIYNGKFENKICVQGRIENKIIFTVLFN